ncbi:MAG: hypothetical protein GF401_11230 [Chitinivibrionales bacterium]|nr:hypothetical protein [Chitinivibrionales bacterium]
MARKRKPYEKPEIIKAVISSETLSAQCSDPVAVAPGFVGFTTPLCNGCSSCKEGVASG